MKKIFLMVAVSFAAIASNAQFSSANLTAAGLTCAMCTKAIYKALEQMPSVSKVDVDIKNSAFIIEFRKGADVDPDALKSAVEDAGFSVAKLKLTGNFNNLQVRDDQHIVFGGKTFHFLKVPAGTLNGQQTLTLVDKNYLSVKEFKKYSSATAMSCIHTGRASACCAKEGLSQNTRVYHVTI